MADIKIIAEELTEANLNLTGSINTINDGLVGTSDSDSHDELKSILTKILEKLDELVVKANA